MRQPGPQLRPCRTGVCPMSALDRKRAFAADLEVPVRSVSNGAVMKGIGMRLLAGLLASSIGGFANASPPPPPPQIIENIAEQLLPTPTTPSFGAYSSLFANDLTVTMNGRTLAANKGEWLAIERARLGKIDRFVYGFAADRDSVLILDRFDDQTDEHCPPGHKCLFDPRWVARAVRYEIGADHLVHHMRILQTNSIMQTPRN
jgi:hypothetical protein